MLNQVPAKYFLRRFNTFRFDSIMLLLFETLPFKGMTESMPSQLVEELIQALNEEIEL